MRFDIKKWQDKHLIEESKLKKEIDFKSQKAFQKYDAKHKMRPTTKVTIGGKTTTAGDAGGGKKSAPVDKKATKPKKAGDDYEATYAKAAKKYTDAKVAAVAKEYNAKPATINPRSGLSDQSIKKIQKNMRGELYKNDYDKYDKEWLNHKLNVQGPENPGGTFERYDFMPHDFSGSESSAEGILTGLDTLMNQSSLERPYIHNTFSQMTKKQAHAGLDALKKKYSYDEDKMVKSSRDPETGEYIPANKHWRNHFETNFGKVKRYERALEEFETPLEPEGIKHYSDKIKKAKRPDFMAMAVSGAGKYKSSETSESVKIQEARVYESIQELRGLEK